jgi:ribonuclease P protein component
MLSFSRNNRLVTKQDFQSVFATPSKKVTRKHLLALYRPGQQAYPRLGIIIGKHHVKRAVDRNCLRRVIRESFRHHKETVKGLDIIIIVRSKYAGLKQAFRDDIDNLWQLLTNPSKSA